MAITTLKLSDTLPLTCSRSGSCCHGNVVRLNPWELYRIALQKGISTQSFRDLFCDFGGIQLRFDGPKAWNAKTSCSQYLEGTGCQVHQGRPLACRLFPLGRLIQHNEVQYMHQGEDLPCLTNCPEVLELPRMTVGDYLKGQATDLFENAQDIYLEITQNLADLAFELLLETGLSASGDTKTLQNWKALGAASPSELATQIGTEWMDALMIPALNEHHPIEFGSKHLALLQTKAQHEFGEIKTLQGYHQASTLLMAMALHLARGIGASPEALAEHWVLIARSHGAME